MKLLLGKHPYTVVNEIWATTKYLKELGREADTDIAAGLSSGGEAWRKARDAVGTGLMVKEAAKYLPLINAAAAEGVKHMNKYEDLSEWTKCVAFDMFTSLALGVNPVSCDPNSTDPLIDMMEHGERGLNESTELYFHGWLTEEEKDAKYEIMKTSLDKSSAIASQYIEELETSPDKGDCYVNHLLYERKLSKAQVSSFMPTLLGAGIGKVAKF